MLLNCFERMLCKPGQMYEVSVPLDHMLLHSFGNKNQVTIVVCVNDIGNTMLLYNAKNLNKRAKNYSTVFIKILCNWVTTTDLDDPLTRIAIWVRPGFDLEVTWINKIEAHQPSLSPQWSNQWVWLNIALKQQNVFLFTCMLCDSTHHQ